MPNIKSPKNGYAYVYLSNESNEPVYFDNFKVQDNRGRIIEEDHYYSFGLKIAAISSKKLPDQNEGNIDNKNLYNDKELFDDADLDWYDYGFRNYDPQIGRFPQLDPLTDSYPELTPYQYSGNEPIANVDMDGLEPCPSNIVGIVVGEGGNNMFSHIVGTVVGSLAKEGSRIMQDNTYVRNPILLFNQEVHQGSNKQATVGPAHDVIRSKKEQAVLDMISKEVEKNTERKRRENKIAYDIPIMGDLFKAINRFGHHDLEGGFESAAMFGITIVIPAGGAEESVLLKSGERAFFSGEGTEARALQEGFQTLSKTNAGRNLEKMTKGMPYIPSVNGQPASQSFTWWSRLSEAYAKSIPKGSTVHVFLNNPSASGIWNTIERPILIKNNVKFIIH